MVAVMFGWLLVISALAAFAARLAAQRERAAPVETGSGRRRDAGRRLVLGSGRWDVGPNAVALKQAGASWRSAADALRRYERGADGLPAGRPRGPVRLLPRSTPGRSTVAGDLPALTVLLHGYHGLGADGGRTGRRHATPAPAW